MKFAWIENGTIRDIALGDPVQMYHPDVAIFYDTEVPDDAANGDAFADGELTKRTIPMPVPQTPIPPRVSPIQFKMLFTPQERLAIKTARADAPMLDDFFELIDDPRLTYVDLALQSVQGALAYLVELELLTEARVAEIIIGQEK